MVTARMVADAIESVAPLSIGLPSEKLGFVYGNPDRPISGVTVCWAPTLRILKESAAADRRLVICHEPLFFPAFSESFPEGQTPWYRDLPTCEKPPNRHRRAVLDREQLAVYWAHSNWDFAPGLGVTDSFVKLIGLDKELRRGPYTRVYQISPTPLKDLARFVKARLGLDQVRVMGAPDRPVQRVGLVLGGFGQVFTSSEAAALQGADVVIFGEALDYTLRCAHEYGMAAIETTHLATEAPGLRAMSDWLAKRFVQLDVFYADSGQLFSYL